MKELKEVCRKHNILLIGTCNQESIYGEISIIDSIDSRKCGWVGIKDQIEEVVSRDGDEFTISGIGELK